jgi:type IV secretion system protein VirB6
MGRDQEPPSGSTRGGVVTGPFSYLGSSIDAALNNFIVQTVSSTASALRTPVFVALTASITIRGFTILRGLKALSVVDQSLDLAFQGVFLILSISSGLYLSNIVAAVNGAASSLLSIFSPGSTDGYTALDDLEAQGATIANHYVALGAAAFPSGGYIDLTAGAVMVLVIAVLLIILGGYFLIAKTALALVLCFGPIFLAACAFAPTRQWFSNWVNKLFNYVLLMALTTANVAMVVAIYGHYLTHLGQVSDATNPFADALDLAVLSGAIVVLSLQMPRLAAALTSGATLSMGTFLVVLRSASIRQAPPVSTPSSAPPLAGSQRKTK